MIEHFQRILRNLDFLSRRNLAISILLFIGLMLFFTVYDSILEQDGLAAFDAPIRAWAADHQTSRMTALMQIVSELSAPLTVSLVTVTGSVLWSVRKKDFWRPALTIGAVALALITSAIIKVLTERDRPTITDLINAHASISYSFPSGHTIGAATLLLVVAYFYCAKAPVFKRLFTISLIVISDIALVAFSRIYLGYHWLTDVTASIGLAFVILAIVIILDTYVPVWRRRKATSRAA